jgi:hypothetical protein
MKQPAGQIRTDLSENANLKPLGVCIPFGGFFINGNCQKNARRLKWHLKERGKWTKKKFIQDL